MQTPLTKIPMERPRSRRSYVRWLRLTAIVLAVLVVSAGTYGYAVARRSLPQVTGELSVKGIRGSVSVFRDNRGVPHIEAASSWDLYFAQGFVTAQDRMWQMEKTRLAGAGRLSEVFGESMLSTDKYLRTLLLYRSAEKSVNAMSATGKAALEAYAAGVTAYIDYARANGKFPPEFRLLGIDPEPWTPTDSAVVAKLMARTLGGNLNAEVFYHQLREKVGDDLMKQVLPVYPSDLTIMKTGQAETERPRSADLPPAAPGLDVSGLLALDIQTEPGIGSNNWVLSGSLTKSGRPLLANDPHLELSTPSIWYQTHLVLNGPQEKQNVIGVIFPGAPGVVIGHNERIAWGVTNTGPDVQDLFIEKRNPQNPHQFEFLGKWEDATVYRETIKVKGKPDVPFEVVVTRHGPIVSEIVGTKENRPKDALALKWTAHMGTLELDAILGFNKATNWPEFREALRKFQVPTQNFVFASVDGTIAYRTGGVIPIRRKGDGLLPVPGWTGEYEWKDFIPFDQMPEVVNPPDGYISTANHKVIDDAYPYFISASWAEPYRAMRIRELITAKAGHTVDDMKRMQVDALDIQARTLLPLLLPKVEQISSLKKNELAAVKLLREWDFNNRADAGAPLVYHLWYQHLRQKLFEPRMGKDLFRAMADSTNVTDNMILQTAKGRETDWIKAAGGLDKLAVESFRAAVTELEERQGRNPNKWQWGKFHRIGPAHDIGASVKPLGWIMNPKVLPVNGSRLTVSALAWRRETGMVSHGGPWRQVVDLSDIAGNSFDVLLPGQSGHFMSPWYEDQAELHQQGKMHPQILAPQAYQTGSKLVLKP